VHAGFEWFRALERDGTAFAALSKRKLAMPVQVLAGGKASGSFLAEQARMVATDVRSAVIEGAGHWLMEEAPEEVIPKIVAFVGERAAVAATVAPASRP